MAKFLLGIFLVAFVNNALMAADLIATCQVKSDSAVANPLIDSNVVVKYRLGGSHNYLDSLEYIHADRTEQLFGGFFRGGYEISYCNPDDHEFSEYSESFSFYANCTAKPPLAKVQMHATLSKRNDGQIKIYTIGIDRTIVNRVIEIATCN